MMATYDLGKVVGDDGDDGRGIVSIVKTSTSGLTDTYTITFTDGNTTTFTVTNGSDATVTIVDNLTSDSSTSVLSAKQGKVLNESIDVIHDLTDGDNLILKSREFVHNLGTVQTEKYQNNVVRYTDRTNQSSYLQYTWNIPSGQFGYNDKFLLTFFAKGTQSTSKLSAYFYGDSGYLQTRPLYHNGNSGSSVAFGDGRVTYDMDTAWKRYYVVWECNSTGDLSKTKRVAIRCGDGAELYLCGMSLKQLPTEYYDLIGSAITYINQ